jgi:hypothetical protein
MREGPSNESPNGWWQFKHHRRNLGSLAIYSQYSHEEAFSGKWTPIGRTKTPLYYAQRASAGLIISAKVFSRPEDRAKVSRAR